MRHAPPLAYLLTFTTYGQWLHGDERGSVAARTPWGTVHLPPDPRRVAQERALMRDAPVRLSDTQRLLCTRVIEEVCRHRDWTPYAINVRTNHAHVVVTARENPDRVMRDLKAWCTRRLREAGTVGQDATVWTRGGSTRYLFTAQSVAAAREYVIRRQGRGMGVGDAVQDCQ